MKKILFQLFLIAFFTITLSLLAKRAHCQTTAPIDSNEIKLISRNATIIQQQLHGLHLDAVLRDKLDSVYNQSMAVLSEKYKFIKAKAAPVPTPKKKP